MKDKLEQRITNTYDQTHGHLKGRDSRTGMQIINSSFMGSGAQGIGDRGGNQVLALSDSNPNNSNDYVWRWRQYCSLYENSWEARKIIRIPVEDALRKPWTVEGLDEKAAKVIFNKFQQLRGLDQLKRSLMLERLLGGCLTFLGLEDSVDDPSTPYIPHKAKADLKFLNAIPLSRIARLSWCTDPLSEHYMRPDKFSINGQEIDVSRCLVWDGEPLFDPYDYALTNFRSNLGGFGPSKLAPIWDDIIKAVGSRQAAYQLIQTNNALIMAVSQLQDLTSTNPGLERMAELKEIINNISVYRAAMIDKENVQITQSAASFGSVPELLMAFLQVLSAASDIPATRFLGQAPGGLNATGDSDLENYYNMIDAYQRQRIEPQLRRVYDIIGWSMYKDLWRDMRKDMTFVFPPLWNTKEGEQADLAAKRIDNALKLWQERAISDDKFIQEINAQGALSVTLDDTDIKLMEEFRDAQGAEDGAESTVDVEKEIGRLKNMAFQNLEDINDPHTLIELIEKAGYDPSQFSKDQFYKGYKIEQEHSDVTKGEPLKIAEIVLAHLREIPDYYDRLEKMEAEAARVENSSWRRNGADYVADMGNGVSATVTKFGQEWKLYYHKTSGSVSDRDAMWVDTFTYIADAKAAASTQLNDYVRRSFNTKSVRTQPSPAQAAAGNYKMDHIRLHGLEISVENPVGSIRRGVDELGNEWAQQMQHAYGYIKGTVGADKDHIDVFIAPDADKHETAVVIDQLNLKTGKFDEHKVMIGFPSQAHAMKAYLDNYDQTGLDRIGTLNPLIHIGEFKMWVDGGWGEMPFADTWNKEV